MQKSQIFHPSVWECQKAREVFVQAFQNRSIDNSLEIAICCALDAVWEAARRHQVQLETGEQESPIHTVFVNHLMTSEDSTSGNVR